MQNQPNVLSAYFKDLANRARLFRYLKYSELVSGKKSSSYTTWLGHQSSVGEPVRRSVKRVQVY